MTRDGFVAMPALFAAPQVAAFRGFTDDFLERCRVPIDQGDGSHRIGRVATHPDARRRGHSSALVRRAIELSGPPVVLSAQAYLVDWYASFGFKERGEHWIEDGIEHVPMRLEVRR